MAENEIKSINGRNVCDQTARDTIDNITVPTKTSDLTNDNGFATKEYVDTQISNLDISQIGQTVEPGELDMPKVFFYGDALPTTKDDVLLTMDYISNTTKFNSYIKLKCQGTSSMSYAKKNFTVNMYSDEARTIKLKKNFKGWGAQSKFCLKANWVDTTHTRNVSGARIGYDMVASRPDSAFKQQLLTAPRYGLVDGFPIKLYFNGEFYGIYTWNIPKDGWMFNMDKSNPNHIVLCAERNTDGNSSLINSCQFRQLWDGVDGGDWSYEFGTPSNTVKDSLNRCIGFVMNSTDQEFHDNISEYFDLYSLLDYYCFSYLTCHLDGLAKNMLMVTYDGVIWGASLYDMDSIYGVHWNGNSYVAANYQCPEQYQEQFSRLWVRIEQCFATELYARYLELRQGALSLGNIIKHVEEIYDVIPDRVFADEKAKWTSLPQVANNTMTRFRNYMRDRAVYVDAQMLEIGTRIDCTGITLSANNLSFTTTDTQTLTATVEPSNTTDTLTWSVSPAGIVTVDGGVVTPVVNGNCTITATCGSKTATCNVNVVLPSVACTSISLDKSELTLGTAEGIDVDTSVNLLSGLAWNTGSINSNGMINSNGSDKYTQVTIDVPGQYILTQSGGYTFNKVISTPDSGNAYNFVESDGGDIVFNVFNVPIAFYISTYPNSNEFDANNVSLKYNKSLKDIAQNTDIVEPITEASQINIRWANSEYSYVELYATATYSNLLAIKFNNTNYGLVSSKILFIQAKEDISRLASNNLTATNTWNSKSLFYLALPIAWGSNADDILAYINSNDITLTLNPSDYINNFPSVGTQTILSAQLTATVEPSNTTDAITWSSNATNIATVNDGLVTAKANGSAVITATCGTQTATCNVTVSGISESGGNI